jgi:hypothetical protein
VRNIGVEKWSYEGSMSVSINVDINVGVSINAKWGYCWKFGLDSWFSLMSTIRD